MPSIFISHSSDDGEQAQRIGSALLDAGYEVFLDFHPEAGLTAGTTWEQEIYDRLRRCDALVCLVTAAFASSRWCFAELALARSVGRPIFPLVRDPGASTALSDVLGSIQQIDLRKGEAPAFERLRRGLARVGLDLDDALAWDAPYPGFRAFGAGDAGVFFGRSAEIRQLMQLLEPSLERGGARFIAVVGASGSGKSSLVRAGLVPRLRRSADWFVADAIVPGAQPLATLAQSLAAAQPDAADADSIRARLAAGGGAALSDVARALLSGRTATKLLLVLDQFEQIVTQSSVDEADAMLRAIRESVADDGSPVRVVVTVRSDYANAALARTAAEAATATFLVLPMDRAALRDVIVGPARRADIDLEPALVDRLVDDAGSGDALPLLAHTLWRLVREADLPGRSSGGEKRRITLAHYSAVGGVEGALREHAGALLDRLTQAGKCAGVIPTLLRLVRLSGRQDITSRRVPLDEFADGAERDIIRAFVDASLLRSDQEDGRAMIEVAHEALLEHWPPLRDAIDRDREFQLWRGRLERDVHDSHDAGGRPADAVLDGARLREAERWLGDRRSDLRMAEVALIQRSVHRRDATRRRTRTLLLAGLAAATLLATFSGYQWLRAEGESRVARSRLLGDRAAAAFDMTGDGLLQSAALATESLADGWSFEAMATQLRALELMPPRPSTFRPAAAAAFGPDGAWVIIGTREGRAIVLDAASGVPLDSIDTGEPVRVVAASRDGIIAAGGPRSVYLWNRASGGVLRVPHEQENVRAVRFSVDGAVLVVASEARAVTLIDARDGRVRSTVETPGRAVAAALHPDGETLLTGGTAPALWRASTGDSLASLTWPGWDTRLGTLWDVGFLGYPPYYDTNGGPRSGWMVLLDDEHVAVVDVADFAPTLSSGGDRTSTTLPVPARAPLRHPGARTLAIHAATTTIATAGMDGTARVWDGETGDELWRLIHPGGVESVAFDPAGRRLVTAGDSVRIWSLDSHGEQFRIAGAGVAAAVFGPDGALLAVSRRDSTVQILSTMPWQPIADARQADVSSSLAFDATGARLLLVGSRTATVLDAASGRLRLRTTFEDDVQSAAFSPDGTRVVVGGRAVLRVLDATTGATLTTLEAPDRGLDGGYTDTGWIALSADARLLRFHVPIGRYEPGEDWVWQIDGGERVAWRLTVDSLSPGMARSTFEEAATKTAGDTARIGATSWIRLARFGADSPGTAAWRADVRDGTIVLAHAGTPNDSIVIVNRGDRAALVPITAALVDPGGRWLVSGDEAGRLRVWPLAVEGLLENACRHLPRPLTAAMWEQLLGSLAPRRSVCDGPLSGPTSASSR